MFRTTRAKPLFGVVALLALMTLAGCGQDNEEEQPGAPTQEEESFQDTTGGGSA